MTTDPTMAALLRSMSSDPIGTLMLMLAAKLDEPTITTFTDSCQVMFTKVQELSKIPPKSGAEFADRLVSAISAGEAEFHKRTAQAQALADEAQRATKGEA